SRGQGVPQGGAGDARDSARRIRRQPVRRRAVLALIPDSFSHRRAFMNDVLESTDVLVVGTGNAASCAALAAREAGAAVLMIDAASEDDRGGNTAYAGGQMRVVFNGVEDLVQIIADLTDEEIRNTDFGTYTASDFFDDMARVTQYRCNIELVEHVIENSHDTLVWLRGKGVRFEAAFGRQSSKVDGRVKFWGGLPCIVWSGGE